MRLYFGMLTTRKRRPHIRRVFPNNPPADYKRLDIRILQKFRCKIWGNLEKIMKTTSFEKWNTVDPPIDNLENLLTRSWKVIRPFE